MCEFRHFLFVFFETPFTGKCSLILVFLNDESTMKCEINDMTHTTEKVLTKNIPEGPKKQYRHRLGASLPCHRM